MSGKMPLETRNSTIATAGEVISAGCRILPRLNQLRKQITLYISNIWFTAVILIASLGHSNDLAAKIGVCQAHDYINVFASSSPDRAIPIRPYTCKRGPESWVPWVSA